MGYLWTKIQVQNNIRSYVKVHIVQPKVISKTMETVVMTKLDILRIDSST